MSFMDEIRKIPPVTRFLAASTLAVSLPVMLSLVSPYKILFVRELVVQRLQIWRLFTSMFFAGTGLNFLFEFVMLYRNSDSLESTYYQGRSADYAWQVLINALSIHALNLPLKSFFHFRALLLSLVTLSSKLQPNSVVSLFGLVSFSNQYFPYALLAMDLVMGGTKAAAMALTGIISGHAWWYLVHNEEGGRPGAAYATAPAWLRRLVGDNTPTGGATGGATGRVVGSAQAARNAAGRAAAQARGYNWGRGQRLGDN